ncbi:MAG: ABC transporter permease [Cyanobacteria bacterium P01_D01_bin.116]
MLNLIDKIGDWNPQLFRELKGRLKNSYVAIALFISLAPQILILLLQFDTDKNEQVYLNFWKPDTWRMLFISFNIIFIFMLLVIGAYLIVNDLVKEERDGTLNFIRLSPQSELSIFTGKMLGVPALIYLMIIAAIPFHIFSGISGNIPFSSILIFYTTLVASCAFFYSLACLFAIFGGTNLRVGKAWFASGLILSFLMISIVWMYADIYYFSVWFRIFSPIEMSYYLFSDLSIQYSSSGLKNLIVFNLPLGQDYFSLLALFLVNYGLCTYWIWQGLIRCFRNPNATLLGKRQSYLLVANFNFIHLGFLMHGGLTNKENFIAEITYLYIWNLVLFIVLFAMILPHRQAIQDWATFRLQKTPKNKILIKNSLLSELIFDEKTPGTLAIAVNLLIAASFAITLTLIKGNAFYESNSVNSAILITICIAFLINLIMIYASIAQIMLMLKNSKPNSLSTGAVAVAILLPILIASILSLSISNTSDTDTTLWLFTIFFPIGFANTTIIKALSVFTCQIAILALLNWYLIKKVQKLGESATKAMFSQSKV